MKGTIQTSLEYLANLCLDTPEYNAYTDADLVNASLIFSHVISDVIWSTNQHLPKEKREELAENTGKMIRELIMVSTGKDMHELVKVV